MPDKIPPGEALCRDIEAILPFDASFDLLRHTVTVAGTPATLYFLDGFMKETILNKLEEYFVKSASPHDCIHNIPYAEVEITPDVGTLVNGILTGQSVLVVRDEPCGALMDTRSYPRRSMEEPENDRVLRGPREGFTEALIVNTALIRRRIRDPALIMSHHSIGSRSHTDVVVAYLRGKADKAFVEKLENKLESLRVEALSMGQQSLAALLIPGARWNPFPKVRYTERPDAAAAMLLEGSVIVICDGYPAVMLLPTAIFDFFQECDDFYFPPAVGTYIRMVRVVIFLTALLLTPTWYLLVRHPTWIPPFLSPMRITETGAIPLLLQLLLCEIAIDGLKLASMNTPSMLSSSLSVVGGLILGDYAVQTGWLCPSVILYMAIVAIAAFTQQSYELGYSFKFIRILTLLATGLLDVWGYAAGLLFGLLMLVTNRTVEGSRSYLYPLIPFSGRAWRHLLAKKP